MGFSPPPDAPAPNVQDATSAASSFAPSGLSGISVCGFKIPGIPSFPPSFTLSIPDLGLPPAWALPPLPNVCDLAKSIAEELGDGGGRTGTLGLEKDPEYD